MDQRFRRYLRALVIGVVISLPVLFSLSHWHAPSIKWIRDYDAYLEWDATSGFKVFRVESDGERESDLWIHLVAVQVKPGLDSFLKTGGESKYHGYASIIVVRGIPLAWRGGGALLTPLMRAADKANLDAVQKLIAEGADV